MKSQSETTWNLDKTQLVPPDEPLPTEPVHAKRTASLIMLSGAELGRTFVLEQPVIQVGRTEDAHVHVHDPTVSRRHATIVCTDSDEEGLCYRITDLDSANGTFVNGVRIEESALHTGDKVRIGDVLLRFTLQDALDEQFNKQVHQMIHYDELTGLMMMKSFYHVLSTIIEDYQKDNAKQRFALAMTDLDGLKKVNDTLGHLAGRMTIREMGVSIRALLRPVDYGALYGGDETCLLFAGMTAQEAMKGPAEQLRKQIETHDFIYQDKPFHVSISQGIAEWPVHGRTPEELIAAADSALYAAKAAGRNCIRLAGH